MAPLIASEHVIVCRCATYYSSPNSSADDREKKQRNQFVFAVKDNNSRWHPGGPYAYAAEHLHAHYPTLFTNSTFVPIPSSKASGDPADTRATLRLAEALAARGQNSGALEAIIRHTAIRSSSASGPDRPSVMEHRATLRVVATPPPGRRIVLVDDVVTQGTQMIACMSMLRDARCSHAIEGIAVAYTKLRDGTPAADWCGFRYEWDSESDYPSGSPVR